MRIKLCIFVIGALLLNLSAYAKSDSGYFTAQCNGKGKYSWIMIEPFYADSYKHAEQKVKDVSHKLDKYAYSHLCIVAGLLSGGVRYTEAEDSQKEHAKTLSGEIGFLAIE